MRDSPRVRSERFVRRQIIETKGRRARDPLSIGSDRDNHRTISRMEELIRDEIGMLIAPSPSVFAGDERILGDVDQRRRCAMRERDVDSPFLR